MQLEAERAGILSPVWITPEPSCWFEGPNLLSVAPVQRPAPQLCRPCPCPCHVSPRLVLRSCVPFQACPSSMHLHIKCY